MNDMIMNAEESRLFAKFVCTPTEAAMAGSEEL